MDDVASFHSAHSPRKDAKILRALVSPWFVFPSGGMGSTRLIICEFRWSRYIALWDAKNYKSRTFSFRGTRGDAERHVSVRRATRDPIVEQGVINLYAMVWNNPVDYFEISGDKIYKVTKTATIIYMKKYSLNTEFNAFVGYGFGFRTLGLNAMNVLSMEHTHKYILA